MISAHAPANGFDFVEFNNMVTPYTNRLFSTLQARGNNLAVVSCTRNEANRAWGAVTASYRREVLPGIGVPVGARRIAHVNTGVARVLTRLRPSALVINGLYPSMVLAALWARRHNVPLALRIDGGANDMPSTAYHRAVRRSILRQCRAVLVCGQKGRDYFLSQGVAANRILEMPIVPAWLAPAMLPSFDHRPFDLLWAAELDDKVKNLSFFRDVVLSLHRTHPGLKVRVLGRGKDAAMLEPLRTAGVDYLHEERRDWATMDDVFLSSRVLLLPSRREPWGLVCNEAMQCGTVCMVSPPVGAANDLVTPANGIVAPTDLAQWSAAAAALLAQPARWTALSQAAAAASGARTIDKAAAAYEGLIRTMTTV